MKAFFSKKKPFSQSAAEVQTAKALSAQRPTNDFVLGKYGEDDWIITEEQQFSHILLVGPTGTGKSSGIIKPGLLREHGSRSVVVIDPKNELKRDTAGAISRYHQVWQFAPLQPEESQCYNPLAYIRNMEDAQDFAMTWIANTGKSQDPFWDRTAELFITAAVLHIVYVKPDAPLSELGEMFTGMSFEDIRALLLDSPCDLARLVAKSFLAGVSGNERLAGSIMTDLAGRFFSVLNPNLRAVTSRNEIDFDQMVDQPIALYLSIPAGASERLQPLSSCFLMQMFACWLARADRSETGRLPQPIECYLDEFANAGVIPHMARRISMLRSTGVGLLLTIQNFSQLESIYHEHYQTILANATTHLVLPGAGQEETEYYSRRIGEATVYISRFGRNRNRGKTKEPQAQVQVKWGMKPDELRTMETGQILVLAANRPPVIVKNIPYYRDQSMLALTHLIYQPPRRTPDSEKRRETERLQVVSSTPTTRLTPEPEKAAQPAQSHEFLSPE